MTTDLLARLRGNLPCIASADIIRGHGYHYTALVLDELPTLLDLIESQTARIKELEGQGWQPIETAKPHATDHMRRILCFWKSRGVCETYWDVDDDFEARPRGWVSPEEGWSSPGDMCIPVDQDQVTHWRPLPPAPEVEHG